jgi:hypothetical protein
LLELEGKKRTGLGMTVPGIPIGLAIEGANCHDKRLVESTLESIVVQRPLDITKRPRANDRLKHLFGSTNRSGS